MDKPLHESRVDVVLDAANAHTKLDFVQNLLTSTSRKSRLWRFRPELPRGVR